MSPAHLGTSDTTTVLSPSAPMSSSRSQMPNLAAVFTDPSVLAGPDHVRRQRHAPRALRRRAAGPAPRRVHEHVELDEPAGLVGDLDPLDEEHLLVVVLLPADPQRPGPSSRSGSGSPGAAGLRGRPGAQPRETHVLARVAKRGGVEADTDEAGLLVVEEEGACPKFTALRRRLRTATASPPAISRWQSAPYAPLR
ncbi:hypothetical protein SEVIR_7G213102v4 [Setaria viridis]